MDNYETSNNNNQISSDQNPKYAKSSKGISIANIVIAIVCFLCTFAIAFFITAAKEAIDLNGGFDAVSAVMTNVLNSDQAQQSTQNINTEEITNALAAGQSAEDIAAQITKSQDTAQYTPYLEALFSGIVAFNWIVAISLVLIVVFSSLIIAKVKSRSKAQTCKVFAAIMIPISIIAFNLPIFILSIILTVKIKVQK